MSPLGYAEFAWQADYGQFYLVDCQETAFQPPIEFTPEMERRSLFVPATGLVIYTSDCLQQHIRVTIHASDPDHPPAEPMSSKPWTRVETVEVRFPSQTFSISSPSMPDPLPAGPVFFLNTPLAMARISWMEFQGVRDDSVPVEPDVIDIALWPKTI